MSSGPNAQYSLSFGRVAALLAGATTAVGFNNQSIKNVASITQDPSTSGVGNPLPIYAQQGKAGSVGGVLTIGGGPGGTPGTNLAGDTRADLGAAVGNVSAKFSLLVGGTSIFDTSQINASAIVTNLPNSTIKQWAITCNAANGVFQAQAIGAGGSMLLDATTGALRDGSSNTRVQWNGTGIGFLGAAPVARQSVTGALSSVTDANAKAVLTSLINLNVNFGLGTNNTT